MKLVSAVAAVLLGACNIALPFPGGGTGFVTVVENASTSPYVLHAHEENRDRYYAAPPNSRITVDTVGELNRAVLYVAILDQDCLEVDRLTGPYQDGGTILIGLDAVVSFEPRLQQSGLNDEIEVQGSCQLAAQRL